MKFDRPNALSTSARSGSDRCEESIQLSPRQTRGALWLFAIALSCACAEAGPSSAQPPSKPVGIGDDMAVLTAPEMEGRGFGTLGQVKAGEYIARRFAEIGLVPAGPEGKGFLQPFVQDVGVNVDPSTQMSVNGTPAKRGVDFEPLSVSDDGALELPVVFAGYGISSKEFKYDDYAGIDVKDKAVLVFDHEPRERDEKSPFRAHEASHFRGAAYKAATARDHGAKLILIARDASRHPNTPDEPTPLPVDASPKSAGILGASISDSLATQLLGGARDAEVEAIDKALAPHSHPLNARASLQVKLIHLHSDAFNVVGKIPGTDPKLSSQALVIGAHYDHLGHGGGGTSLAPPETKNAIHVGADDNASGVTGILAIAQALKAAPLRRTVVIAAFAGEELGILGSVYYTKHPSVPAADTIAMLNLDMVGRLRDALIVQGTGTSPGFEALVSQVTKADGVEVRFKAEGYGPSDHTAFYLQAIPVLFFFTGVHEDYHKPSDTPDKINVPGIAKVATVVEGVAKAIDAADERPRVVTAPPPPSPGGGGGNRGYGAYLGTIPDFAGTPTPGVPLAGVKPGSPAEKAGLAKGDIIVHMANKEIRMLEDLFAILQEKRSGDTVEIVVLRNGQKVTLKATFGDRP